MDRPFFISLRRFACAALLACALVGGIGLSGIASVLTTDPIKFRITQDGDKLGHHSVSFRRINGDLHVNIAIDIQVRLFFLPVFSYRHRNHEIWRDGRLISLHSETDDDGDKYWVKATASDDALNVEGTNGSFQAPLDTIPTSYWSIKTIGKSVLLDTQHGKLVDVSISPAGENTLDTFNGSVDAQRYDVTGDLNLSLWYSKSGDWVKTSFNVRGAEIEYFLDSDVLRTAERSPE